MKPPSRMPPEIEHAEEERRPEGADARVHEVPA
jgi:hypothetical protein